MERHSFRIVSGDSHETTGKLCLSTKFPHQEIRWNYSIFCSVKQLYIENNLPLFHTIVSRVLVRGEDDWRKNDKVWHGREGAETTSFCEWRTFWMMLKNNFKWKTKPISYSFLKLNIFCFNLIYFSYNFIKIWFKFNFKERIWMAAFNLYWFIYQFYYKKHFKTIYHCV